MRLVYLHTAPVPSLAANAVQVAKMCDAFAGAGVDTTLMVPGDRQQGSGAYARVSEAYGLRWQFEVSHAFLPNCPGSQFIFSIQALASQWGKSPFLVYTRAVSIASTAHFFRVPFALELHVSASSYRQRLARRLDILSRSRYLRGVIVISDKLRADYERNYPMMKGRILVAHDGANPVDPSQPVKTRELAGDFRVGYVGHLYPGKGMEIILPLARQCPWATFHIVGGREEDITHWKQASQEMANIHFHGHVPHEVTREYISGMDAVLAPYMRIVRGEGGGEQNLADWMSPLKIFEYMAQSKAIIASDLPVLREVLRHGENALLCDPDDPAAWAVALEGLARQRQRLTELGERAQRDFLNGYSWDQRAKRILDGLQTSLCR